MPWLSEDPARLAGFREGDSRVLTEVYEEYVRDVIRHLQNGFSVMCEDRALRFHGCHSPFDLDDTLQETFLRAFSPGARAAYDGDRPFRAYLLTIARNVVLDRLRRHRRFERLFVAESPDARAEPLSFGPDVEHDLMRKQMVELYLSFREGLTDGERRLAELRFERGLSRQHAATELGLSMMRLRTREQRLRARLEKRLREAGYSLPLCLITL